MKNYKMPIILLISIIIGSILGLTLDDISVFIPFKDIFLNAMFTIVVPLVFISISSSIANMSNLKRLSKILKYTFIVFTITSLISSIFMLLGISLIDLTTNITVTDEITNIDITNKIVNMFTVSDFKDLFSKDNMMPLIISAIIFGIAVSKEKTDTLKNVLDSLSKVLLRIVKIIMYYSPIGICAYFACLVNEYGASGIGSYAKALIFYVVMSILYFLIIYTIYAYIAQGKNGVKKFYKNILPTVITSLATCSSLATLPTNMKVLNNMGIDEDISDVALPIGSTMHMEGSSMSSILKIALLFSIYNKPFTGISTIFIAVLIAVLASVVMSGIPGGGLIGEALIVSIYGFPTSAFLIISTIGWLVDSPATCINVSGDAVSCMLIDKYVNKRLKT